VRVRPKAAYLEDETAGPNYALRLTEAAVDQDTSQENFALRLSAALEAIQSAQDGSAAERAAQPPTARSGSAPRFGRKSAEASSVPEFGRKSVDAASATESGRTPHEEPPSPVEKTARNEGALSTYLTLLDKLPPVRLPIGPPIPWRIALPALVGLVAVMVFMNRPTALAQSAVQPAAAPTVMPADSLADQQARQIINASSSTAQVDPLTPLQPEPTAGLRPETTTTTAQPGAASPAQPLGVPDSAGLGFDFVDLGVKLAAVLGLAYGSLLLLKKVGLGGTGLRGPGGTVQGMQVVSSLVLAPNRSVHVLKAPGGKTLLVGVTPTQVNLIADLGEVETS
jgi:flagellar biogenesis protein FliO